VTNHCPECGFVLSDEKPRSRQTHNHYFAAINDAWENLPEKISGEFPSPEHLRKYAMIRTGHCITHKMLAANNKAAIEAATFIMELDEFALCEVAGNVVTVYRAQSQSFRAMGKDVFKKSKEDVLGFLSQLIGADVAQKEKAA
jgi:hypothetical protein